MVVCFCNVKKLNLDVLSTNLKMKEQIKCLTQVDFVEAARFANSVHSLEACKKEL